MYVYMYVYMVNFLILLVINLFNQYLVNILYSVSSAVMNVRVCILYTYAVFPFDKFPKYYSQVKEYAHFKMSLHNC